jgi:hypothetical protein
MENDWSNVRSVIISEIKGLTNPLMTRPRSSSGDKLLLDSYHRQGLMQQEDR